MNNNPIESVGNVLESVLHDLEEMRKPILENRRWVRSMGALTFASLIFLIIGLVVGFPGFVSILIAAFFVLSLITVIRMGIRYVKARKAYTLAYKQQVYPPLLKTIDPTWEYHPEGKVPAALFDASDLFTGAWDRYHGDDLVTGTIGEVRFQCSELHVQEEHESTDSDGHTTTTYTTVFKGLFFVGEHNLDLGGRTTVLPFKKKGWISKAINRMFGNNGPEKVEIRDEEFSSMFMVHSTRPYEAHNLIGPEQIQALKALAHDFDPDRIRIAFLPGKVYCAVSFRKDLFEPRLRGSLLDKEELHQAHRLFSLNQTLVQRIIET